MKKRVLLIAVSVMLVNTSWANVVIRGTRIIYPASTREISVQLKNTEKATDYLVQSWISPFDSVSTTAVPFIITPPLNKLLSGRENLLRIIYIGSVQLPKDRESVYLLNVKSVPGVPEARANRPNQLNLSMQSQIKLFYRPEGLAGNANTAYEKLVFTRSGNTLIAKNPTPYHVTFKTLSVGGKAVSFNQPGMTALMVPPFGEREFTTSPAVSGKIKWSAINDYGGITPETEQ